MSAAKNTNSTPKCQLLVSVRNVAEAQIALEMRVDWIDLKEPGAGALGAPDPETARQVASVLANHPQRSMALGELMTLDLDSVCDLKGLFPFTKIGLSEVWEHRDLRRSWTEVMRECASTLATSLVPVLYADWEDCAAVPPDAILDYVKQSEPAYVLVDTFQKDGRSLLDFVTLDWLDSFVNQARSRGSEVVVAGSLQPVNIPQLTSLPIQAIGVRGAACASGRSSEIQPHLLSLLQELLDSDVATGTAGR